MQEKKPMLNAFGLWKGKEGGKVFASGSWGRIRVLVFQAQKRSDKSPDFNVVFVEDDHERGEKKAPQSAGQAPAGGGWGAGDDDDKVPW